MKRYAFDAKFATMIRVVSDDEDSAESEAQAIMERLNLVDPQNPHVAHSIDVGDGLELLDENEMNEMTEYEFDASLFTSLYVVSDNKKSAKEEAAAQLGRMTLIDPENPDVEYSVDDGDGGVEYMNSTEISAHEAIETRAQQDATTS